MDKQNVVHPYNKYLVIKRNEVCIHATMCMNLENIMLSERSQSQKTIYHMVPFIQKPRIGKSVEIKETRGFLELEGMRRWGAVVIPKGYWFSF